MGWGLKVEGTGVAVKLEEWTDQLGPVPSDFTVAGVGALVPSRELL